MPKNPDTVKRQLKSLNNSATTLVNSGVHGPFQNLSEEEIDHALSSLSELTEKSIQTNKGKTPGAK